MLWMVRSFFPLMIYTCLFVLIVYDVIYDVMLVNFNIIKLFLERKNPFAHSAGQFSKNSIAIFQVIKVFWKAYL